MVCSAGCERERSDRHGCTRNRYPEPSASGWSPSRSSCTPAPSRRACPSTCCTPRTSRGCKQQYVCATCGEVVERDAMVHGYEYAKDQYAVLVAEELKALEQQSDQSIEIEEFVPIASVDPIYFEKTYLLGPDKGGSKAYRLLREAMAARRQGRGGEVLDARPPAAGAAAPGAGRADDARALLCRRGARLQRDRARRRGDAQAGRARARRAAHRAARAPTASTRRKYEDEYRKRRAGADRAEGRRPGDHRRRRRRRRRGRSSISWRR